MPDTTPCTTRAVSGWLMSPNRSASITATGRAPIEMMSRTMPPTPVAAPWNGSMYDGWLCDSILNVTAQPSPMSSTPAFSPMPTMRCCFISGVTFWPNWRRYTLLDLYEQCSLHMTEYMASSALVGRRPRMLRMRSYSSGFRPSAAYGCSFSGVVAATSTVSSTGLGAGAVAGAAVADASAVTGGELQRTAAGGCRGAGA